MLTAAIKRIIPGPVKHPLLAYARWQWEARGLPAQSPADIAILKKVLTEAGGSRLRVFEWGSGASTVYYSRYLTSVGRDFEWHAVDNSAKWHERVREKIGRAGLDEMAHTHCREFPAFWELPGYTPRDPVPPKSYCSSAIVEEYVALPSELGSQFDVMIVDGRFRRRCLLVARDALAPQGVVLLHDASKPHYHPSLSAFPKVRMMQTGKLPGLNAESSIALCSLEELDYIREL